MKVEREIAGFALPFAAGVLITAYAEKSFCMDSQTVSQLAFTSAAIALACLSFRERIACSTRWRDFAIWMPVCLGAFCGGALSAATGISLRTDWPSSQFGLLAGRFGNGMQQTIDAIPFQDPDTGALIKALLTGNRSSLSPAVTESFRASGASHILALSGLHLGIVYMIFMKLSGVFGNSIQARRCRSCMLILLCGFYTLATGAGASIVRAFIFILLGEIANICGRHKSLPQILFAAMILQLIVSPLSILSISFQLSYAAMAGIVFVFPWLKGFWPGEIHDQGTRSFGEKLIEKPARWIWNSAAISISCQLTTGPLVHIYFGAIPKHFLLTNLLALPLVGILIPSAALTAFLSALGCCPSTMTQATEALAGLLTRALEVISTM